MPLCCDLQASGLRLELFSARRVGGETHASLWRETRRGSCLGCHRRLNEPKWERQRCCGLRTKRSSGRVERDRNAPGGARSRCLWVTQPHLERFSLPGDFLARLAVVNSRSE